MIRERAWRVSPPIDGTQGDVVWLADAVSLRLVRLDLGAGDVDRLAAVLDEDERLRAARFARAGDSRRFIVRRGRLRELLGSELGCAPEAVPLVTDAYGKPRLARPGPRFSLSASGEFALFALAQDRDVGCDLEVRRPDLARPELAARYFSLCEQRQLASMSPETWVEAFFNCWTRKEALVKGLGLGLSYPLDSFDVSVTPCEPATLLRGPPGWRLRAFEPLPGLHAALALGPAD